jgi:aspartate-semialdehyde dehydrogenase
MSKFTDSGKLIGVVGATGAVGAEMVNVLSRRDFPVKKLKLFASKRSAGKKINTPYGEIIIEEFTIQKAREMDIVFLAVSGSFALEYGKKIGENDGPIVIDNSSAFRYDQDVSLVIPEVNPEMVKGQKLISNPNCTTAIAAVALWPIHQKYGLKKVIISSYQASSGAGAEGMEELREGTKAILADKKCPQKVFAYPLAFNVIPHIDKFLENDYTKEEMKVAWETRKIFGIKNDDDCKISVTAVRVPTLRAHAEAITIETQNEISPFDVRELLKQSPGVDVVDDPTKLEYPMPLNASTKFNVECGRIRQSLVFGKNGLDLFVCGDQLLKGAALNAVQIAEVL